MARTKKKREFYSVEAVECHVRRHHPSCPADVLTALTGEIISRRWESATLGTAFGIVATNYARHKLTDYERLMRDCKLERDEARMIVAQEVRDIIAAWKATART